MINPYVALAVALAFAGLGAVIKYQHSTVIELREEIVWLDRAFAQCQASQENLVGAFQIQSSSIDNLNIKLISKKKDIASAVSKNAKLDRALKQKTLEVYNLEPAKSCEESIDLLLEEALDDKVFTSIVTSGKP